MTTKIRIVAIVILAAVVAAGTTIGVVASTHRSEAKALEQERNREEADRMAAEAKSRMKAESDAAFARSASQAQLDSYLELYYQTHALE